MVRDDETQHIVTLGELESRIKRRYETNSFSKNAELESTGVGNTAESQLVVERDAIHVRSFVSTEPESVNQLEGADWGANKGMAIKTLPCMPIYRTDNEMAKSIAHPELQELKPESMEAEPEQAITAVTPLMAMSGDSKRKFESDDNGEISEKRARL